ncbi:hypothetical protein CK203_090106 [Vitis vinifera]|uniref:Uncharacterized protein n=1 Tax=Vitis vinifera TaxID=29760 RepID=A0A438E614_VITVI|nr:hypothetical protein CK203_090106 [Vitis vinifera]
MEEAITMKTPMSSSIKLDMDEKGQQEDHETRKCKKFGSLTTDQVVDWFVGGGNLKGPPTLHFSPVFLHTLKALHIPASKIFWGDFSLTARLKLGFSLISMHLGLRVGVCSLLFDFILPLDFSFSLSRSLDGSKARDENLQGSGQATYRLGGPVLSTVRGVEIKLSPKSICRILNIPSVGLRVYEAKAWPTVVGFEPRKAVQRATDSRGISDDNAYDILR